MSCDICCDKFNKSSHLKVICPFFECSFETCKQCVRTYILNTTNEPHCMNCKNLYDKDYLVKNLNKSFMETDYKNHRRKLLVDKEIAKSAELMPLVSQTILKEEKQQQIKEVTKQKDEFYQIYLKNARELDKNIDKIKSEIQAITNGTDKGERKQFIKACPVDNCKGFLSTQHLCEICKIYCCKDCEEPVGYTRDAPHVCNDDNIKSRALIKKETKPCPKCGVRIFKIIGCDQMWCTECQVTFSWNTGKLIVTTQIHNPHYYEYIKKGGIVPRNPEDTVCGGLINYSQLNIINKYIMDKKIMVTEYKDTIFNNCNNTREIIGQIYRLMTEFNDYRLRTVRQEVQCVNDHTSCTIEYIRNMITKDELADRVFAFDNRKNMYTELLHVYELISVVATEGFHNINNKYLDITKAVSNKITNDAILNYQKILYNEIIKFIEQFNSIITYFNYHCANISYNFNKSVTSINRLYTNDLLPESKLYYSMTRYKYNTVDIKQLKSNKDNFKYLNLENILGSSSQLT